ncbi:hypothetical protein B296_00024925 [Ensete ventricosum]|uniref:Uncharacterized protein n=1 Tax=Ensete ventricosum TaxID=4639 RepID=A0A426Y8W9_ENSVE|nr:hypothetical protein B296_00024925 [Ensete ventricosum]
MCRGFYSKGYEASVPEVLTTPVAYHAIILRRSLCGPCDEARGVLLATGEHQSCPPYPCRFDRTTVDPPMLVLGRLQSRRVGHVVGPAVRGRRYVAAKTFSRLLIWVPKMRSCNEPSTCSEGRLVFDPDERELIRPSRGLER